MKNIKALVAALGITIIVGTIPAAAQTGGENQQETMQQVLYQREGCQPHEHPIILFETQDFLITICSDRNERFTYFSKEKGKSQSLKLNALEHPSSNCGKEWVAHNGNDDYRVGEGGLTVYHNGRQIMHQTVISLLMPGEPFC